MELLDDMMGDAQAFDALRMIDWDGRTYAITQGEPAVTINSADVHASINVDNNDNLPAVGVYVRESFDRLFHHMGKMERAIRSGLIVPEDVRSPLATYYLPLLRKKYDDVVHEYMTQLGFEDASGLLQRFSS